MYTAAIQNIMVKVNFSTWIKSIMLTNAALIFKDTVILLNITVLQNTCCLFEYVLYYPVISTWL